MNWIAILFGLYALWIAFSAGAALAIAEERGFKKKWIYLRMLMAILVEGLALYLAFAS